MSDFDPYSYPYLQRVLDDPEHIRRQRERRNQSLEIGPAQVGPGEPEPEPEPELTARQRVEQFEANAMPANQAHSDFLRAQARGADPLDSPLPGLEGMGAEGMGVEGMGLGGAGEITEEQRRSIGEHAGNVAMGGVRFISGMLEPIQLPQDVFFGAIEAGLDDNKTMLENLKEIEWAKYAPFGHAPARVTDGRTILELAGVEDERTQKWGGIAMDLVVDPLIFGSVARAAGKIGKIDGLVNLGNRMDQAVAPAHWAHSAYRRIPAVRSSVDEITTRTLHAIRNPEAQLFGIGSKHLNTAIDWTVSRRPAKQMQLGDLAPEARATNSAARAEEAARAAEEGRLPRRTNDPLAEDFVRSESLGAQRAEDRLMENALELRNLRRLVGDEGAISTVRRVFENLGQVRRAERDLQGLPTIVRDTAVREMYDWLRDHPASLVPGSGDDVRDLLLQGLPDDLRRLDPVQDLGEDIVSRSQQEFDDMIARIRKAAVDNGYERGVEGYLGNFRQAITRAAAMNARNGYELSGMGLAKQVILQRGAEVFGSTEEGSRLWDRILRAGVSEKGLSAWLESPSGIRPDDIGALTARGRRQAKDRQRTYDRTKANQMRRRGLSEEEAEEVAAHARDRNIPEPEIDEARFDELGLPTRRPKDRPVADREFTWREVLGDEWEGFSSLGVGAYLAGLRNGHMYRAYGMWQTKGQFSDWAKKIEEGVIIPNNIIEPGTMQARMRDAGFEDEAESILEYIEAVSGARGGGRAAGRGSRSGAIIDTRKLGRHLAERLEAAGATKSEAGRRAREAIIQLRRATNAEGKPLKDVADRIRRDIAPSFERQGAMVGTPFSPGRFSERTDFDQETLDIIGEMANPFVSMAEDTEAMKRRLPVMEFMNAVFQEGKKGGAIRSKPFTDPDTGVVFQHVKQGFELVGPFHDKYVHPQLMAEIRKAAQRRSFTPSRLGHLRSLITGGYLAAPSVLSANVAGGLLSAWEAGIAPHRMLKAMAETWRPLQKDGGLEYDLFQQLRQREAISQHSVAVQDVGKTFTDFRLSAAATAPGGMRKAMGEIDQFYQYLLRGGPRATQWAGLSGFQFTERWMKTAAYKASLDAGETANRAAELARISVFDYEELPDALRYGRDYGVLLFPGFPYFMTARTLQAATTRPAVPAVTDRLAEAVTSSFFSMEERLASWANMPDWLREDQGVPIARWEDEEGNERASFIPLNQLLPTSTFAGNPYAESLATGGLWRPFLEALYAHVEGSGTAFASQRYGQQVFSPEQNLDGRAQATLSFLFNNLAPSTLRKLWSPTPGSPGASGASGVIPSVVWPKDLVNGIYSFEETQRTRAQQGAREEALSLLLRSTRQIAMEGPLIGIRNEYDAARREHGSAKSALTGRIRQAQAEGDTERAGELAEQLRAMEVHFAEKWREMFRLAGAPDWSPE